jgi:hypothetical protein
MKKQKILVSKSISLPFKLRVILVVLTLLNPNMTTTLPYHPPGLRERGLNYKTKLVVQK